MRKDIEPFSKVDDAFVIVSKNGVEYQRDLYERERKLYAKHGGGFVRLMSDGKTSIPSLVWRGINGAGFVTKPKVWSHVEIEL